MQVCLICKRLVAEYCGIDYAVSGTDSVATFLKYLFVKLDLSCLRDRYICEDCKRLVIVLNLFISKYLEPPIYVDDAVNEKVDFYAALNAFRKMLFTIGNDNEEEELVQPRPASKSPRPRGRPRGRPRTPRRPKSCPIDNKHIEISEIAEYKQKKFGTLKNSKTKAIQCKTTKCIRLFRTFTDLSEHARNVHKEKHLDYNKYFELRNKHYREINKQAHKQKTRKDRNSTFPCLLEYCKYRDTLIDGLIEHKINGHYIFVKYVCTKCPNFRFTTEEELDFHMDEHHKQDQVMCSICNMNMKSTEVPDHMLRHIELSKYYSHYSCDFCNAIFTDEDSLVKHSKRHQVAGDDGKRLSEILRRPGAIISRQLTSDDSAINTPQKDTTIQKQTNGHVAETLYDSTPYTYDKIITRHDHDSDSESDDDDYDHSVPHVVGVLSNDESEDTEDAADKIVDKNTTDKSVVDKSPVQGEKLESEPSGEPMKENTLNSTGDVEPNEAEHKKKVTTDAETASPSKQSSIKEHATPVTGTNCMKVTTKPPVETESPLAGLSEADQDVIRNLCMFKSGQNISPVAGQILAVSDLNTNVLKVKGKGEVSEEETVKNSENDGLAEDSSPEQDTSSSSEKMMTRGQYNTQNVCRIVEELVCGGMHTFYASGCDQIPDVQTEVTISDDAVEIASEDNKKRTRNTPKAFVDPNVERIFDEIKTKKTGSHGSDDKLYSKFYSYTSDEKSDTEVNPKRTKKSVSPVMRKIKAKRQIRSQPSTVERTMNKSRTFDDLLGKIPQLSRDSKKAGVLLTDYSSGNDEPELGELTKHVKSPKVHKKTDSTIAANGDERKPKANENSQKKGKKGDNKISRKASPVNTIVAGEHSKTTTIDKTIENVIAKASVKKKAHGRIKRLGMSNVVIPFQHSENPEFSSKSDEKLPGEMRNIKKAMTRGSAFERFKHSKWKPTTNNALKK